MPDYYPTPTASPFDDIEQYIGLLLGAIDAELDRDDAWATGEAATARGYIEDLKAYLMLNLVNPPPVPESFTLFGEDPVTPGSVNTDSEAVYLGVRFRSSVPGQVTAIRFFKATGSAGVHVGYLWSDGCDELAQADFEDETADGWQEVAIDPVTIEADTDYIASVYFPTGVWNRTSNFFTADHENPPLTATDDSNGRYIYPAFGTCPAFTFENTNYWIDLRFVPGE